MTATLTTLTPDAPSSPCYIRKELLQLPLNRYERGQLSPTFIMRCPDDRELDALRVPVFDAALGWLDWNDRRLPHRLRHRALGCVMRARLPIIERIERLQQGRATNEDAADWFARIVQDAPRLSICAMLDEFLNDHRGWTIDKIYALRPGTGPRGGSHGLA